MKSILNLWCVFTLTTLFGVKLFRQNILMENNISFVFEKPDKWDLNENNKPARSVEGIIVNETNSTLRYVNRIMLSGIINDPITSLEIPPGGQGKFFAESNGFGTGTEGHIYYEEKETNNRVKLDLYFSNPYLGGNSYQGSPKPFKVAIDGGGGNNAKVKYVIRK